MLCFVNHRQFVRLLVVEVSRRPEMPASCWWQHSIVQRNIRERGTKCRRKKTEKKIEGTRDNERERGERESESGKKDRGWWRLVSEVQIRLCTVSPRGCPSRLFVEKLQPPSRS